MGCPSCGGTEIETDSARGDSVCVKCGQVLENSVIVSEVQFQETGGVSTAIGQFVVGDDSSGARRHIITPGFVTGLPRESREITLRNARRRIGNLCQILQLGTHFQEMSFNLYKMALHRRLTHGYRNALITSACVYITCRTEAQPHMLIDFCDASNVDLFTLGRAYLKLSRALHINIPVLDPCLYVLRFCHQLEFGEKTQVVSNTAVRLVQRMKRDWIHTGRRPAGLCGAALLIAARMHGFNRGVQDVVSVVKVHESTLKKRLVEFGETPSGKLTVEEFLSVDLEEEQDPPAFAESRKKREKERVSQLIAEGGHQLGEEVSAMIANIESMLHSKKKKATGMWAQFAAGEEDDDDVAQEQKPMEFIQGDVEPVERTAAAAPQEIVINAGASSSSSWTPQKTTDDDDDGLDDLDDEELDGYLMSPAEVKQKTRMWTNVYGTFLEDKEKKRKAEEEAGKDAPEKKKRRRRKRGGDGPDGQAGPAATAKEAVEKMLSTKKLSKKINYDVLKSLDVFTSAG